MVTNNFERVDQVLSRGKEAVRQAEPRRKTILKPVATQMGRKVIAEAQAEIMKEALAKLVQLLYEETGDGRYWNMGRDGRVDRQAIRMPWTNAGHRDWGLGRTQSKVLRHAMMNRRSPFLYNERDSHWYVDLAAYPTVDHAMAWLERVQIDADLWNQLMDAWKERK